jgi:succinate dehydrogenase/fumarate reductase-like Fe-S protein
MYLTKSMTAKMKRREFITLLGRRGCRLAVCGARAAAGNAGPQVGCST